MARRRRLYVSAPHVDDCGICDRPLGTVELLKRPSGYVHKSCWMKEKGE